MLQDFQGVSDNFTILRSKGLRSDSRCLLFRGQKAQIIKTKFIISITKGINIIKTFVPDIIE